MLSDPVFELSTPNPVTFRMVLQPTTFEEFVKTCTPLVKFPEFEDAMRSRVCEIVNRLLGFDYESDDAGSLVSFMRADLDFFKVLLKMGNLSQEKFRRVISAQRFSRGDYGNEWSVRQIHNRIRRDDGFALAIASMFVEGRKNPLVEHVADFYLDQLAFPEKWANLLQDEDFAARIAREMLSGEYSDKKGDHIESVVAGRLTRSLEPTNTSFAKGRVKFVGKEVDLAVPNIDDPEIMIMVSYTETTSSTQNQRATEQETMFNDINTWNSRNNTDKVLVNVVDGGGWLARRKSMIKMFNCSHYCLNLRTLSQLDFIVEKHLTKAEG